MQTEATGNQMSPGCPVQGSRHTGCNTGSTGSGSGSTAATAEHTGERHTKSSTAVRASSRVSISD